MTPNTLMYDNTYIETCKYICLPRKANTSRSMREIFEVSFDVTHRVSVLVLCHLWPRVTRAHMPCGTCEVARGTCHSMACHAYVQLASVCSPWPQGNTADTMRQPDRRTDSKWMNAATRRCKRRGITGVQLWPWGIFIFWKYQSHLEIWYYVIEK